MTECGPPNKNGKTPCQANASFGDTSIEELPKYISNPDVKYKFEEALTYAIARGLDERELAKSVVEKVGREPIIEAMEKMVLDIKSKQEKKGDEDD